MPDQLLATKLFSPARRPNLIRRARLTTRLNAGLQNGHRLTLISATAGYGKTTLVVDWLAEVDRAAAWLALDDRDDDPVQFVTYLIAALQTLDPNLGEAARSLLQAPQLPPVETIATALLNDVAELAAPGLLVLDDYHVIRTAYQHAFIEFLIDHLPPTLHLVIVTREDPPLPLSRLRVRGQLTEIRADEVRFTLEEAADFVHHTMHLTLSADEVHRLETRTEGWIAGLQLAALSLQGRDEHQAAEFIAAFGGSDRYVIDYLVEELLSRQPVSVRNFLQNTAILDRFNAELCNAVTGRSDGEQLLAQLDQSNLFVIALDRERRWYRYHHLFADSLRAGLDQPAQTTLHRRAASWFEAAGAWPEAIQHALAAHAFDDAARLILPAADGALQRGELITLRGWLRALPEATVRAHADLVGYSSWTNYLTGAIEAALHWEAALTDADMADWSSTARCRIISLRAWLANARSDPGAAELAQQALELSAEADPFFRVMALMAHANALREQGHTTTSTETYLAAAALGRKTGAPLATIGALLNAIFNLNDLGRRREALQHCRQAQTEMIDRRGQPLPLASLLAIPLSALQYEANEIDRAFESAQQGQTAGRALLGPRILGGDCERVLAQIQFIRGQVDDARRIVREMRDLPLQLARVVAIMNMLEAEFNIRTGQLTAAQSWADAAGLSSHTAPGAAYESTSFTYVRWLRAQQRWPDALELLKRLDERMTAGRRHGRLITVSLLQALTYHDLRDAAAAHHALERAVRLAAPEDYRRRFLDEGTAVARLLPHVRGVAPTFVDEVLRAFGPVEHASSTPLGVSQASIDPLSDQELNVLRLLADGLSNRAIADRLVITVGTAKWHVHNLYARLGVGNRTQAVARARELNLI